MKLKYIWKYYIKPIITFTDPYSPKGLRLRVEKLKEDDNYGGERK